MLDTGLAELQAILADGKSKVVFITGAGISVNSGIPLYRSEANVAQSVPKPTEPIEIEVPLSDDDAVSEDDTTCAIWDKKLESLCQKRTFLANPRLWYQTFWFDTHHRKQFLEAVPNEAHVALSLIVLRDLSRFFVITQNVDRLHQSAGLPTTNLIEIHGRIGVYRCSNDRCPRASEMPPIDPRAFEFLSAEEERRYLKRRLNGEDARLDSLLHAEKLEMLRRRRPCQPHDSDPVAACPACKHPIMPLTLLFDESYLTHEFYQFEKAAKWLEHADAVVFIGTSLSVFFTTFARDMAFQSGCSVFSINTTRLNCFTPDQTSVNCKASDCAGGLATQIIDSASSALTKLLSEGECAKLASKMLDMQKKRLRKMYCIPC